MQWLAWYRNSIFWKFRNALGFNKFALYAKIFEKQKQILQKKKVEKKKKAKLNWCKIEVVTDLENTVTENQFSKTIMSRGENGQPWWVTESFTSHSKCKHLTFWNESILSLLERFSFTKSILKMVKLFNLLSFFKN